MGEEKNVIRTTTYPYDWRPQSTQLRDKDVFKDYKEYPEAPVPKEYPEWPQLEKAESGAHIKGPVQFHCPVCGHKRRAWHMPGVMWFIPPDRKPEHPTISICYKCGALVSVNGLMGCPRVSTERVRDPTDLSIKKYPKKLREMIPDDRGW